MFCFSCLAIIMFLLYFIFDLNYFFRILFTAICSKYMKKKAKLMNETTIYGICTTQDLDAVCSHMNNARYLRELDFARADYLIRTNIYDTMRKMDVTGIIGGLCTRYRRPIPFLMVYKIVTKLIYWDEKSLYFDHKFVNLRNDFIHTVIFSKYSLLGLKIPLTELMNKMEPDTRLPEITEDFKSWLESMEHSSQILRKKD